MTSAELLEAGARRTPPAWLPVATLMVLAALAVGVLLAQRPPTVAGHGTQVVTVHRQYQPLPGRILS